MSIVDSKVLVLNRSYFPIGICAVKDAFKLICQDVADILDKELNPYDYASWAALEVEEGAEAIGLVHGRIRVPRIIRLKDFNKVPSTVVKFNRTNVFMRDKFTCCYCEQRKPLAQLSMDHVLPRAQGGKTDWLNIATSCVPCNQTKADKTPEQAGMRLRAKPFKPSWTYLKILFNKGRIHEEWVPFLKKAAA